MCYSGFSAGFLHKAMLLGCTHLLKPSMATILGARWRSSSFQVFYISPPELQSSSETQISSNCSKCESGRGGWSQIWYLLKWVSVLSRMQPSYQRQCQSREESLMAQTHPVLCIYDNTTVWKAHWIHEARQCKSHCVVDIIHLFVLDSCSFSYIKSSHESETPSQLRRQGALLSRMTWLWDINTSGITFNSLVWSQMVWDLTWQ